MASSHGPANEAPENANKQMGLALASTECYFQNHALSVIHPAWHKGSAQEKSVSEAKKKKKQNTSFQEKEGQWWESGTRPHRSLADLLGEGSTGKDRTLT